MSVLEIILYSILGTIIILFMIKWLFWDKRKSKKEKKNTYEAEEKEDE